MIKMVKINGKDVTEAGVLSPQAGGRWPEGGVLCAWDMMTGKQYNALWLTKPYVYNPCSGSNNSAETGEPSCLLIWRPQLQVQATHPIQATPWRRR